MTQLVTPAGTRSGNNGRCGRRRGRRQWVPPGRFVLPAAPSRLPTPWPRGCVQAPPVAPATVPAVKPSATRRRMQLHLLEAPLLPPRPRGLQPRLSPCPNPVVSSASLALQQPPPRRPRRPLLPLTLPPCQSTHARCAQPPSSTFWAAAHGLLRSSPRPTHLPPLPPPFLSPHAPWSPSPFQSSPAPPPDRLCPQPRPASPHTAPTPISQPRQQASPILSLSLPFPDQPWPTTLWATQHQPSQRKPFLTDLRRQHRVRTRNW